MEETDLWPLDSGHCSAESGHISSLRQRAEKAEKQWAP
jgi:hypothetical protein